MNVKNFTHTPMTDKSGERSEEDRRAGEVSQCGPKTIKGLGKSSSAGSF